MDEELEKMQQFYNTVIEYITNYSFQILGAILLVIIGIIASKYVYKYSLRLLGKTNLDKTISKFISSFLKFMVIGMMIILALGKLGISIAPFIAALGALSLTAGLALQGSVGISYDSDVKNCIAIIEDILKNNNLVSSDNNPIVGIEKFADSSIDIGYRYRVPTNSYYKAQYSVNLEVLDALRKANITIPFPQREIKML